MDALKMIEIGKRVNERMRSLGMNQSQLAAKVSITPGTVSRLISGKGGEPTYEMLRKYAAALDTSPQWLIDGDSLDFNMAMRRLEADPVIRDALLKLAGWYETSPTWDRDIFRDNMRKLGDLYMRKDVRIRALSTEDVVEIERRNGSSEH